MDWRRSPSPSRTALPIALLLALPLLLLLANDSWIWDNPDFNDTSIYVSFFRHYLEWKWPFVENYKSSRLPWILPGVAAYKLFPAAVAHHVLYLTFLAGETLLVYGLTRRRFGSHAAFVVAAAVATSTFSHRTPSYHNQPAATYFLASLYLLEHPRRWPHTWRGFAAGAALALALTTDSLVLAMGPGFALYALATLPAPPRPMGPLPNARDVLLRALFILGGMAVTIAGLGAVNRALGGKFLFFLDQITYSIDISRTWALSRTGLRGFVTHIAHYPLTAMPILVLAGSGLFLAVRALWRQWDFAIVAIAVFAASMAAAAEMQVRNMGVLEIHILLHPFFAPMYLALAALIGSPWFARRPAVLEDFAPPSSPRALSVPFLIGAAACFLAPLILLGAPISRLLIRLAAWSPSFKYGVPILLGLAGVAAVSAVVLRRRPAPKLLAVAACLGLANATCTEDSQPAHMYQLGRACPFREDVFRAMIEGDGVIGRFDPANRARFNGEEMAFLEPQFDGAGWCKALPTATVSNALLLMHYFYTSAQLVNGYTLPPLGKFILATNSDAAMASLTHIVELSAPPGSRLVRSLDWRKTYRTFTQNLRGFDVELMDVAGARAPDPR